MANNSPPPQQIGQVNLVMRFCDSVRLVVDLDAGLAAAAVSAVVLIVSHLRLLDDRDAAMLERELEVDAGGERSSG